MSVHLVTKIDVFIFAAGMMPLRATTLGALSDESLSGLYFNSKDLSGSPMMRRTDRQIDFAWGAGPGCSKPL